MTFSIPITEISTCGKVRHMRPLPSDSTTHTVPLSATAKFAPLIATGTLRNLRRRCWRAAFANSFGLSDKLSMPSVRVNSSRISARFLWMAGTRICDEVSPAS